jgi:membrane fusion protein
VARELGTIETEMAAARARGEAQLAAMDAQRAALEQERIERAALHRQAIVTPVSGTVATVLVEAGQMVAAGTALATVLPRDAKLEGHLFASSRSIGFLRVGQEVLLRYLAYPHQKFGAHPARVIAIARNPLSPTDLGFVPPDGSREPVYRIKVDIASQAVNAYGRLEPLRPGMQVEADVLLDRRRLIEWIFEPLLSLAGRA